MDLFLHVAAKTKYFELFVVLLNMGLRIGELCALEWKDIDFEQKVIHVYKTLNRITLYYDELGQPLSSPKPITQVTPPKRNASYRDVPMMEEVVQALLSWKLKQDTDKIKKGKKWGKSNPLRDQYPNFVFTTSTGNGSYLSSYIPSYLYHQMCAV